MLGWKGEEGCYWKEEEGCYWQLSRCPAQRPRALMMLTIASRRRHWGVCGASSMACRATIVAALIAVEILLVESMTMAMMCGIDLSRGSAGSVRGGAGCNSARRQVESDCVSCERC